MKQDTNRLTGLKLIMKTSDLRIGSLVNIIDRSGKVHIPNPTPFKVFSIEAFRVKITHAANNFAQTKDSEFFWVDAKDIAAINLSEMWMIKFHFKKVGINYEKEWLLLWKNQTVGTIDFVVNEPHSGKYNARKMQYVHELQNLYHSITGEELYYSL